MPAYVIAVKACSGHTNASGTPTMTSETHKQVLNRATKPLVRGCVVMFRHRSDSGVGGVEIRGHPLY